MKYRDFEVELAGPRSDGSYPVRVLGRPPGGEMPAADTEAIRFDPEAFRRPLLRLERRSIALPELIEFGEQLASMLLPGTVRTLFERSLAALKPDEGLRLRLRVEPLPLAALPWEYTYVARTPGEKPPGDFLALRPRLSITRYETIGPPPPPLEKAGPLRIVAALAAPLDQEALDVDADRRAIEGAARHLREQVPEVEVEVVAPATRQRLIDAIAGCDVFHFAGHGVFEGTEPGPDGRLLKRGQLILETEHGDSDPFDSAQLALLLGDQGVRLVVLGACNAAARDEGAAWAGVAPALVRENVPGVVAMQFKVYDASAISFAELLYTRVLGGDTVDEAVAEWRRALAAGVDPSDRSWRDWGAPVLYLRALEGYLFPLPAGEPAEGASVPAVRVQQKIRRVRGTVVGADVETLLRGRIDVRTEVYSVEEGGTVIGYRSKTVGAHSRSHREDVAAPDPDEDEDYEDEDVAPPDWGD